LRLSCRGTQNTHLMFNNCFFFENCAVYETMLKITVEPGRSQMINMAQTHCLLDTYIYKHTVTICSTYCFSTATVVAGTRLNVTLYVHCLSCLYYNRPCKKLAGVNLHFYFARWNKRLYFKCSYISH
jgi:hypothetical protein